MSNQDDIQFNSEEVALVKKTKETISVELGETISIALDANATSGAEAKKLLKKFQAIKTAKSRLEANGRPCVFLYKAQVPFKACEQP